MWESGAFCRISKRGGKGGKLGVGVFQAFLRASFPPRRLWISICTERSDADGFAVAVGAAADLFRVMAVFVFEARKKSRCEGRGRILPSFPIVWVMTFFDSCTDRSASAVGSLSSLRALARREADTPCRISGLAILRIPGLWHSGFLSKATRFQHGYGASWTPPVTDFRRANT